MAQAFVTGGTGLLGINLIEQLVSDGWDVVALHRKSSNLKDLSKFKVQMVEGAIDDVASLERVMPKGVDVVYHVAANTSFWSRKKKQQWKDNVDGTRNMVATALKKGAKRFIHTSSLAAFGFHRETVTEEAPSIALETWINYPRTKWHAEQEVKKGIEKGLKATILNPANIIGPYDYNNWSQMFSLIDKKKMPVVPPGRGSFCHVREVARVHITALEKGRIGENYLLGGADASYMEMAQVIAKLLDRPAPKRILHPMIIKTVAHPMNWWSYISGKEPDITPEKAELVSNNFLCDSSKAVKELGYDPADLKTMLEDCYKWLVKEDLLPTSRT
ncbi:MAG: SDR family oxidoreductase [Proteobacteria bacterium]|nr:SDR family oxidoreductase [Pseudomonadota bacterium]